MLNLSMRPCQHTDLIEEMSSWKQTAVWLLFYCLSVVFLSGLMKAHVSYSSKEMIAFADHDGSGEVTKKEFLKMMRYD